jgi:hypothetical protein
MDRNKLAHELVPMNIFADPEHPDNHFPNFYHPDASILWLHQDLAVITLHASKYCYELYGWKLHLIDSLRPAEAQEKMADYGYHPSLISREWGASSGNGN